MTKDTRTRREPTKKKRRPAPTHRGSKKAAAAWAPTASDVLLIAGIAGLVGIGATFVGDALNHRVGDIRGASILGMQVSALAVLLGLGFRRRGGLPAAPAGRERLRQLLEWLADRPTSFWLLAAFIVTFVPLFVRPMLFNPENQIRYFTDYIPREVPIGIDMTLYLNSMQNLLLHHGVYDQPYPPLHSVLLAPLLLVPYPVNYHYLTIASLVCFVLLLLILPALFEPRRLSTVAVFFFLTGLVSYGLQFELERGQFNLLALLFALLAIYVFHYHRGFEALAYVLFTAAVQLKLFPAVYLLLFVRDWRDWRGNLLRLFALGATNVALLFSFGTSTFLGSWQKLQEKVQAPWFRPYDHSLRGYLVELGRSGASILSAGGATWVNAHPGLTATFVVLIFAASVIALVVRAYVRREEGVNFDLLLALTAGALFLPSVSWDYKLSWLPPTMALALAGRPSATGVRTWFAIALTLVLGWAYSVSLMPFMYRPDRWWSSFPLLFLIMIAIALLSFTDGGNRSVPPTARLDEAAEARRRNGGRPSRPRARALDAGHSAR